MLWHYAYWLGIRKSSWPVKIEWWGVDVIICLERGGDCLHMVQLMPLHPRTPSSLASFKSRLVLPFWYRFTQVVLKKKPLLPLLVVRFVILWRRWRRWTRPMLLHCFLRLGSVTYCQWISFPAHAVAEHCCFLLLQLACHQSLQCFDAVGWAAERASGL